MSEMEPCGVCQALHPMEDLVCFDDTLICPDCLESSTVVCARCGERLWADDDQGDENTGHLCENCYDRYYNTCEECHRVIPEEDAYYEDDDITLCYDCHCRHRSRYAINAYSYKPEPIFYGGGPLYMGVELEIDEGGESDNNAKKILEVANAQEELIYIKRDGSLVEGMEIVTHPLTLDYHMNQMPWAAVMDKAKQLDYRSHQAKTCGLHIHVNRTAFGDNIAEQEEVIARILYFFSRSTGMSYSSSVAERTGRWSNGQTVMATEIHRWRSSTMRKKDSVGLDTRRSISPTPIPSSSGCSVVPCGTTASSLRCSSLTAFARWQSA